MAKVLRIVAVNIPCCLCIGMAWYMVAHNLQHWGWVLFTGALFVHVFSSDKKEGN